MKLKGFTLAEVSIALIIMGIICSIMLNSLNPNKSREKLDKIAAQKAIALFEETTVQMLEKHKTNFPLGAWMAEGVNNTWEFVTYKDGDGNEAESIDIVDFYKEYIEFDSDVIDFCDFTELEACDDKNIKGAKLPNGVYFGIEKFDSADTTCPQYYLPQDNSLYLNPVQFDSKTNNFIEKKCWGKIYFDINGPKAPNEEGKDIFIYGMGEYGLEKSSVSISAI